MTTLKTFLTSSFIFLPIKLISWLIYSHRPEERSLPPWKNSLDTTVHLFISATAHTRGAAHCCGRVAGGTRWRYSWFRPCFIGTVSPWIVTRAGRQRNCVASAIDLTKWVTGTNPFSAIHGNCLISYLRDRLRSLIHFMRGVVESRGWSRIFSMGGGEAGRLTLRALREQYKDPIFTNLALQANFWKNGSKMPFLEHLLENLAQKVAFFRRALSFKTSIYWRA